jgi:CheY-like chemotaxis protein
MHVAKILAVDDEAFELLITQRFRRQIRAREFDFRFARHGEEALAALTAEPDIDLMLFDARYQHAGDGWADPACGVASTAMPCARGDRLRLTVIWLTSAPP